MDLWRNTARAASRLPVSAVRCVPQPRRALYKPFHSTFALVSNGMMVLRQKLSTLSGPPFLLGKHQPDVSRGRPCFLCHNSSGTRTGAINGNEATDSGVFVSPTTPFTAARLM